MGSTEKGRDPQQELDSAIARADVTEILRLLDDASLDLDRKDVGHDLQTPLMRMCHMRASLEVLDSVVEKLETCAWNPNVTDSTGRTLLMHAVIADRLPVALLCLENGCDVDLCDRDGNSALAYAVRSGNDDMLRVFLDVEECRPLVARANNLGQTPLDMAVQDGHDTMAGLLATHMPSHAHVRPTAKGQLPKAAFSPGTTFTLTPGTTLGPPSPLSPRSPAISRHSSRDRQVRRTVSDKGQGLGLSGLWTPQAEGGDHGHRSARRGADLATLVSGKLARMSRQHSQASHSDLTSSSDLADRQDGAQSVLTQRELTSCSDACDKSPRRSKRKHKRLLRRETEEVLPQEELGDTTRGVKPSTKELLRCKKDSASLPDLRDFKGRLVASGEATPVGTEKYSSESSQKSSGRRGGEGNEEGGDTADPGPGESYLERYKNSDLSASCSLPPLQSSSADSADRRKDIGAKLVHSRKNNSTDDVMLRSLIV